MFFIIYFIVDPYENKTLSVNCVYQSDMLSQADRRDYKLCNNYRMDFVIQCVYVCVSCDKSKIELLSILIEYN